MKTGKVLLLEDHSVHRGLLAEEMEDRGFEVVRVSNVEEAARALEGFIPDIFVLDLVIKRNHESVIEWVNSYLRKVEPWKSVPILFVTAYGKEFSDQISVVTRSRVLGKPFAADEVYREIRLLRAGR